MTTVPWRDRWPLVLVLGLFVAAQLPGIVREPPGLDEDLYAVPGLMLARGEMPRIPYIPARDPRTIYDHADVALYTLPPLGFLAQVPFFLVLPPGIAAARLASVLAGLAAAVIVHELARTWLGSQRAALFAVVFFVFGRTFLFPALTARPDMLAACCGLIGVALTARADDLARPRRQVAAGVAAGLSLLAHPFGIVPCVQIALRLALAGETLAGRAARIGRFGIAAAVAFSMWIPWIIPHTDLFRHQFGGNVLGRAGPGLGSTLLHPGPVLVFQAGQIVDRAGLGPSTLAAIALVFCAWRARATIGIGELAYHLIGSTLLLLLFMGRHPLLGYFVYPSAFAAIAVGGLLDSIATRLGGWKGTLAMGLLLVAVLFPGAGARRVWAQYSHGRDPDYDHRVVARRIMADLPARTLVAADGPWVLEFYLAGRPVIDALYLEFLPLDYEFVVLGRDGVRRARIEAADLALEKTYGDASDPFAPYAELYRRKPGAAVWHDPPATSP